MSTIQSGRDYKGMSEELDRLIKQKQDMRDRDQQLIDSGEMTPIEVANKNSCFSGVDLHEAKGDDGFDLF